MGIHLKIQTYPSTFQIAGCKSPFFRIGLTW